MLFEIETNALDSGVKRSKFRVLVECWKQQFEGGLE